MPPAVPPSLRLPRYGDRSLSELLPALVDAVSPGLGRAMLGLRPADRAVLLLVDGLGAELLQAHPEQAPFLTSPLDEAPGPLTAGFPATTATSLASLGTGLAPGEHGIVGYEVAVPGAGFVMNSLTMDARVDPRAWQPEATWFERAAAGGGWR